MQKLSELIKFLKRKTQKYYRKIEKLELDLKKAVQEADSSSKDYLFFNDPQKKYLSLLQKFKNDSNRIVNPRFSEYLGNLDSLNGALSFLNKSPNIINHAALPQVENSLVQLQQLQSKMIDAEQIRQFIIQRKDQLKQLLIISPKLTVNLKDIYNDYNKQLYYYSTQLLEFKQELNSPDKIAKRVLSQLEKIPSFSSFMKKNSFLAGLTDIPDNYSLENMVPGMQTKGLLEEIIHNYMKGGAPNAASILQQSIQLSQGQLEKLKAKVMTYGAGSQNADLGSRFKPNNEKFKPFFRRIEVGTNIQNTKGHSFIPTITDFGVSIGYKLDEKNTAGIGVSYKVGWGNSINHIHLTAQGVGLRSFVDLQIKKSYYISGGFEYNDVNTQSSPPSVAYDFKKWEKSGLIGISKIISMQTKLFKKTKIQVLWDFLSPFQQNLGQSLKFRLGYNF